MKTPGFRSSSRRFLRDLTRLLGLDVPVPNYSTFWRRAAPLTVAKLARPSGGPVHLAIDATGLKLHGGC